MRKLFKALGTIAMLAALLSFASCDDLLGSLAKGDQTTKNDPIAKDDPTTTATNTYKPVVYTSYDADGTEYKLTITRTSKAAVDFTPATGDSYKLVITTTAGAKQTSTGQIAVSGTTFTLKHTGTGGTFSVTVSANSSSGGSMAAITGGIPIDNSATKVPAPSWITSQPPGNTEPPVSSGLPKLYAVMLIDGFAQVGQTLTAYNVAPSSSTGVNYNFSYQWKRGTASIGTNSSTYVVASGDIGSKITVTVTSSGYSGSVTSDPTDVVVAADTLAGWVYIESYVIQVGCTLTAYPILSGSGTISYQWKRGSTIIGTDSTYVLTAADKSSKITVTVSMSGSKGSVTSDPEGPVTDNDFTYSVAGSNVTITAFKYNSDLYGGVVNVPQTLDGKPVTSIGASAFKDKDFTEVYISQNVRSIEESAFDGTPLEWIGIGSDVTLGTSAFPTGFVDAYEKTNKAAGWYNNYNDYWSRSGYTYDY